MSFAHARKVMKMKLDPNHKNFAVVMRAQQAIAVSVFNTTTRVQSGLLRSREEDELGDLLDEIKTAEKASLAEIME